MTHIRWIEASGAAGPVIDLAAPAHDEDVLTVEAAGDRIVPIMSVGRSVNTQDVLADGTVEPRRMLIHARQAVYFSSASNGHRVAVAVQAIGRNRSSIYAVDRAGSTWAKPVRLARGGPGHWPLGAMIAVGSRGGVGSAFGVYNSLPGIHDLGVRSVVAG